MPAEISDDERMTRAMQSLRNMIRDKRQLNRLLMGQFETQNEELRQCIVAAIMDWNTSPPLIGGINLATHPNKFLLLQKAAVEALTSAGIWHSREHMPSADGGTSADDHAKANEYSAWIDRYNQEYERKKSDLKMAMNVAAALGDMGVMSEYGLLQSYYGVFW